MSASEQLQQGLQALLQLPCPIALLDQVVHRMHTSAEPARGQADQLLTAFREHADAWTRVDGILETSQSVETKFYALQILENVIKYRWRSLPVEQSEGIKTYLVQKIISLSSDEAVLRTQGVFVNKLNVLLVQVLKHDWPLKWPSFIPDVVSSSKSSELLCENNIKILKLLSEEVFDFSKDSMTLARAESLRASLAAQFQMVFELCDFILRASARPSLLVETLRTLQRFVTWIPDVYIFETALLPTLCTKFLPVPAFRVDALLVLTEVGSLAKPQYDKIFEELYTSIMEQLMRLVPPHVSVKDAYARGSASDQYFLRHLALFLTGFFKTHLLQLEAPHLQALLQKGLEYLVKISELEDAEIFKICLEYWNRLANDLYAIEVRYTPGAVASGLPGIGGVGAGGAWAGVTGAVSSASAAARKSMYAETLSRVREVLIARMAKPEEVLIEEDESGEVVRETTKDTEALAQYKVMRDTLVYLTHLDPQDTEKLMLAKLTKQSRRVAGVVEEGAPPLVVPDGSGRTVAGAWDTLNTLCWAIGSISGTLSEAEEKTFLVAVIRDLLGMCEAVKGKNNKAVVASNIMYVVGQYPRFLKVHWKFLKTVVLKLFEFMHESHPGVQDMAVDTFLKIANKCRKKFVTLQPGEGALFVEDLCSQLPTIIADLQTHQVHTFYEATGAMIAAHPDAATRYALVDRLMKLPNDAWVALMARAAEDFSSLQNPDVLKDIQRVLRTNVCACRSVGPSFDRQLGKLYLDALNVYKALSGIVNSAVASQGEYVLQSVAFKAARGVKRELLHLVGTFTNLAEDTVYVAKNFIPPLLHTVLDDYVQAVPAARDAEVLVLMGDIIRRLKGALDDDTPRILEAVFEPTLVMITTNFLDYPEHRTAFFKLLDAINTCAFSALFRIPPAHQKLVVDSVVWAFKHTGRDIGEMGLTILDGLLHNVSGAGAAVAQPFYGQYLLSLLQDLLYVLTDRLHKAHLKLHAVSLQLICQLVESGRVTVPLWETPKAASTGTAAAFAAKISAATAAAGGVTPPGLVTNQAFLRDYLCALIASSFPNLSQLQVQSFVAGLVDPSKDLKAYKNHLRDFLIEVLEFKGDEEAAELYAEEKAAELARRAAEEQLQRATVPGLVNPHAVQLPDDNEL